MTSNSQEQKVIMALGTSCPLHNWVGRRVVSACVPVVRQGSHLEAQEATSGHEVGKCLL